MPNESDSDMLLWLAGAGHELRPDAGYFYNARERRDPPHITIQLTLAGAGFHQDQRNGRRSLLSPGRAFVEFIPGPFSYGFAPESRGPYELVFVSLAGPEAERWGRKLAGQFGPVIDLGTSTTLPEMMLGIVSARALRKLDDPYQTSATLYQLLMQILGTLAERRIAQDPLAVRAIDIMRTQATDPDFSIERLASIFDISREHLARRFRETTGKSPSEFLLRHRLQLAATLLHQSEHKLHAIARACGFSGANYFVRVFKAHTGITPGAFRERPWMTLAP